MSRDVASGGQSANNHQPVDFAGKLVNQSVYEVHPIGRGVACAHDAHHMRSVEVGVACAVKKQRSVLAFKQARWVIAVGKISAPNVIAFDEFHLGPGFFKQLSAIIVVDNRAVEIKPRLQRRAGEGEKFLLGPQTVDYFVGHGRFHAAHH